MPPLSEAIPANDYRFCAEKEKESEAQNVGNSGNSKKEIIDIKDLPRFSFVEKSISQKINNTAIDIAILSFYILIAIAVTFIAFIRYDVR